MRNPHPDDRLLAEALDWMSHLLIYLSEVNGRNTLFEHREDRSPGQSLRS